MKKDYILSDQLALMGHQDVVGFGRPDFHVRELDRDTANRLIVENHYSRKFYSATYIHLGVHHDGQLRGVLQFGYALNPASGKSVVANTGLTEYLELNRMWLHDDCPRNSESMAIAYSIKYIKRKFPAVGWIQSFADERCGRFGIVYQAANFEYFGEHSSTFWTLGNEVFHNILMTCAPDRDKKSAYLQANKDKAVAQTLRQFRYLYWIKSSRKRDCLLKQHPFPKHYSETENNHEPEPEPTNNAPMKLATIKASNIKGATFEHELKPLTIFGGPNGTGKTARLNAIALALFGRLTDRKTNQAIHELASGSTLEVAAAFEDGSRIIRKWERKGKSVKSSTEGSGTGFEQEWPLIMLDAAEYFEKSPAQQTAMIFDALGSSVVIDGKPATVEELAELIIGSAPGDDVRAALTAIGFDGETPISFLTSAADAIAGVRKETAATLDRMTKSLQGLAELRARVNDTTVDPSKEIESLSREATGIAMEIGRLRGELDKAVRAETIRDQIRVIRDKWPNLPESIDRAVAESTRNKAAEKFAALNLHRERVDEIHRRNIARQNQIITVENELRKMTPPPEQTPTVNEVSTLEHLIKMLPVCDDPGIVAAMERGSEVDSEYFKAEAEMKRLVSDVAGLETQIEQMKHARACPVCGSGREHWRETGELAGKLEFSRLNLEALSRRMAALTERREATLEWIEVEQNRRELQSKLDRARYDKNLGEMMAQRRSEVERQLMTLRAEFETLPTFDESEYKATCETMDMMAAAIKIAEFTERLGDTADPTNIKRLIYNNEERGHAIRDRVGELQKAAAAREREKGELRRMAQIEIEAKAAESTVKALKGTEKKIKEWREDAIKGAFGPLVDAANRFTADVMANPIEVRDLELGRYRDGVWCPVSTFSGSEQAVVFAAVSAALAVNVSGKILVVDELARIDESRRAVFLRNIQGAINDGLIDQFFGADIKPLQEFNGSAIMVA